MQRGFITLLLLLCSSIILRAQSVKRDVFAAGETIIGDNKSSKSTIGQFANGIYYIDGNIVKVGYRITYYKKDEVAPAFTSLATADVIDEQAELYTAAAIDSFFNKPYTSNSIKFGLKNNAGDDSLLLINSITGKVSVKIG
ncbi:MAG: hypothetical protein ACKOUQ_11665, partial [Aquirufa sp.]